MICFGQELLLFFISELLLQNRFKISANTVNRCTQLVSNISGYFLLQLAGFLLLSDVVNDYFDAFIFEYVRTKSKRFTLLAKLRLEIFFA